MDEISDIMKKSFGTNFMLAIMKVIAGIFGKSSALVADGIHSFSDLLTDVVAIVGNFFSSKPADKEHPYGHGKLEYLTSIGIAAIVIIIGFLIIGKSIEREVIVPSVLIVFISLFTIIAKFVLARYLLIKGNLYNNNILLASGKESSADVISSIVVLISSILMQFTSINSWLKYADIVASIIVGIFIIHTGFSILKENISDIIGQQDNDNDRHNTIKQIILSNKEIKQVDSIVLLKFGSYYKVIIELSMDGNISLKKSHDTVDKLEQIIRINEEKARYITIHVNPL